MKRTRTCTSPPPKDRGKNCSTLGASEETKPCFLMNCPTHGNFSQWSVFSKCSKPCGTGFQRRTRNCSNPEPKHGGQNCSSLGLALDEQECNTHSCPIHGGYSVWTKFTQCTVSCRNGARQRTRNCSNPEPKHGGRNCSHLGPSVEVKICNKNLCPIHGGFSEWTEFSECTKSCGNGSQNRTRKCSNPKPQHGGKDCSSLGANAEIQQCNTQHCPINGGYTQWTHFSACSRTCGTGKMNRSRYCTNPKPQYEGSNCSHLGLPVEVRPCFSRHCPVHGGFSEWSKFSECLRPCGVGLRNRTRYCTNPEPMYGGRDCRGEQIEFQVCNVFPCPVDGNYAQWSTFSSCSKSCGSGTMRRTRNCTNPAPDFGGNGCLLLGPAEEVRKCNVFPCPVNGNYSSWSNFSICSKTCGNGTMERLRNCSNPAPKHGGKGCSLLGPSKEIRSCNEFPCPIHGNFSSWSIFSVCSKSCGNGTKTRTRNCSNPFPKHGGENCSLLGSSMEERNCNIFPCPVHGNYTPWSNFSSCTQSCDNGTKTRTRSCTNPEPQHNGRDCSSLGSSVDVQPCSAFPCPVHGGYTAWGNFTPCTQSCGNGTMYRNRNCTNPVPDHGGTDCSIIGPALDVKSCNEHLCPINGGYTLWSEFTQCSITCGTGTQQRTRNCSNPLPQFGGRNCSRLGAAVDVRECNLKPCPIDGGYSPWSAFSKCTRSCNGGKQKRWRLCNNPSPKHGGKGCSRLGPPSQIQPCNSSPCPVHGGYSEWSEFEACTRTCGGGRLIRRRNCTSPPPAYAGRNCSGLGPSAESIKCNTENCPGLFVHFYLVMRYFMAVCDFNYLASVFCLFSSPDIVFNVAVNLTSEKWDAGLATDHNNQRAYFLRLKIRFGVCKPVCKVNNRVLQFVLQIFYKGINSYSRSIVHSLL